MKITIDSIYKDNNNLFTNNALITADERLTDIVELSNDLDLIVEMTYGNREIFKRYLTDDDTEVFIYDLSSIHKSVYATLIENQLKYKLMLESDEQIQDVNPLHQFFEHKTIGERERTNDIKSRVDTTTHGNINNTTTYGQMTEQNVVGQAINSTQLGAREQTGAVTSFSSSTFENTDKTTQAQTTDQQTLGSHTDTLTTSHATPDTEQITRGDDTLTHGAHKDIITDSESVDEKYGYNDVNKVLEERRRYANRNTLNEIISDVINGITYGVYTF